MAAISTNPVYVKLMNDNEVIKIRGVVGEIIVPGQAVYLDGANGWKLADADAVASAQARGIAVSDNRGSVSFTVGQTIDIVTFGRVGGFSSMTPGGSVFVSVTAGSFDHTAPGAGDFTFSVGWAESESVLFVHPQVNVPTVNV
jgi:hypothetical protein